MLLYFILLNPHFVLVLVVFMVNMKEFLVVLIKDINIMFQIPILFLIISFNLIILIYLMDQDYKVIKFQDKVYLMLIHRFLCIYNQICSFLNRKSRFVLYFMKIIYHIINIIHLPLIVFQCFNLIILLQLLMVFTMFLLLMNSMQ